MLVSLVIAILVVVVGEALRNLVYLGRSLE
jgi:hypothetical protein